MWRPWGSEKPDYKKKIERLQEVSDQIIMTTNDLAIIISTYFSLGLQYEEIIGLLAQRHNVILSMRTLKRRLASYGLYRRKNFSDIFQVAMFIFEQLKSSGCLHGYRWMHSRCLQNGFIVQKEMVRILLGILDPSGVAARVKRKLKRRHYRSKGPNYIWHLDSYDKLKPYGICVNGCIDGFSRFIIWLRVGRSNNNPRIVAGFYVEALTSLERVPHSIRSDMGTENSYIAEMQSFLRRNGPGSRTAFLYGTSQHNQRIESWWGILRKECVQFWMEFFEQMKQDGYYTGDFIDKSLIQYFFMDIIRKELENVVETWNAHRIRKSKHCDINGRPMVLYQAPFLKGTEDYSLPLDNVELNACAEECDFDDSDCDNDILDLADILMEENSWTKTRDPYDRATLYLQMRDIIKQNL